MAIIFFFWLPFVACEILVPRPGIEPTHPVVGGRSFHWTSREVPKGHNLVVLLWNVPLQSQDDGVKGHELTPSYENTKITTNCWMCVCAIISNSLWPFGLQPARLLHPWDFSGKNTARGCPFPSPGDLPNPGIKSAFPAAPAFQADSLALSHQGSHQQQQKAVTYQKRYPSSKDRGAIMIKSSPIPAK